MSNSKEWAAARALRAAAPTRRHAAMLFEQVADLLGDQALVEASPDGSVRQLFVRDASAPEFVVPWPLLVYGTNERRYFPMTMHGPDGEPLEPIVPKRRPGRAPKLRGLGPGHLEVGNGLRKARIDYDAEGRWFENTLTAPLSFAEMEEAVSGGAGAPVELLARYLADLDPGRSGPGRVRIPDPDCASMHPSWTIALREAREAAFADWIPWEARWAALDGFTGRALAFGTDREEVLRRWRSMAAEVRPWIRPKPPGPEVTIDPEDLPPEQRKAYEAFLRAEEGRPPRPDPTIEETPVALLPLGPPPADPPPFGEWVRLLGRTGETFPASVVRAGATTTIVGAGVLAVWNRAELEEAMANADRRAPEVAFQKPEPWQPDPYRVDVAHYAMEPDPADGSPRLSIRCRSSSERFVPGTIDGDDMRDKVIRQTPRRPR